MSEQETRPPTPAKTWVHPLIEYSNGSLYPYWNLKNTGLTPYFEAFKRAVSAINPFAYQQVPTSERVGLNVKFGNKFYKEEPYPSATVFHHHGPVHHDPLKQNHLKIKPFADHMIMTPTITLKKTVPRFCEREIKTYKRCVVANDNQEEVCKQEQENIIAICPLWALNNLKEKRLGEIKDEAMLNNTYKRVMEIPSYNKGRTVADVPLRTWEDGNRDHLRPGTLWADDRYADITAEEVEAAKERVKKRRAADHSKRPDLLPKYDRSFEVPPTETPLYSV